MKAVTHLHIIVWHVPYIDIRNGVNNIVSLDEHTLLQKTSHSTRTKRAGCDGRVNHAPPQFSWQVDDLKGSHEHVGSDVPDCHVGIRLEANHVKTEVESCHKLGSHQKTELTTEGKPGTSFYETETSRIHQQGPHSRGGGWLAEWARRCGVTGRCRRRVDHLRGWRTWWESGLDVGSSYQAIYTDGSRFWLVVSVCK